MQDISWWKAGQSSGRQIERGRLLLANLLGIPSERFEQDFWLKKPYRKVLTAADRAHAAADPSHPMNMMPEAVVRGLLVRKEPRPPRWLHDVDCTRYVNGRRTALPGSSGDGEVDATVVWDAFQHKGYSIRLVHPQQWHQPAYELCAYLQEYFGFPVGCSAYLTPPGEQGFP